MTDFDNTLKNLRGNLLIDYKQLGLMYKLYLCEVSVTYHSVLVSFATIGFAQ